MDWCKQIQQSTTNFVAQHENSICAHYTTFTYILHRKHLYKTIAKQKLYLKHWMFDKLILLRNMKIPFTRNYC